jgi:hypothetical protein
MPVTEVLLDGALRAAQLLPLLFALNTAQAQLPRPPDARTAVQAQVAEPAAGAAIAQPLTLAAQHHDVRIRDAAAEVRSTYTLRNDTAETIAAHYLLPYPALVGRGTNWYALRESALDGGCGDGDLSPAQAQFIEAGEAPPVAQPRDVIVVAPGEEITLEIDRTLAVARAGGVARLAVPLATDPNAALTPRLTADVLVESAHGVRRLRSPTHAALVDGLGDRMALLSVEPGRIHRGQELAIEFELAGAAATAQRASR